MVAVGHSLGACVVVGLHTSYGGAAAGPQEMVAMIDAVVVVVVVVIGGGGLGVPVHVVYTRPQRVLVVSRGIDQ